MSKYVISDIHFGHRKILQYEPMRLALGSTVEEMNLNIVKLWNQKVKPDDVVYVLGDVAFGLENLKYMDMCLGTKILVMGNHDQYGNISDYFRYFKNIYGSLAYKAHNKHIIMTHIPVHDNQLTRFDFNLHGHMHSRPSPTPKHINCCIEHCPMFQPMNLDILIANL